MNTSNKPSDILNEQIQNPKPLEKLTPPGLPNLVSLTDGREPGDFKSIYPLSAWAQIALELAYLVLMLVASFYALVLLARFTAIRYDDFHLSMWFGPPPGNRHMVTWAATTLSGVCGGCASALKWLYHVVAKRAWHRDRLLWRLIVPLLSGTLAVFAGLIFISGLVPLLSKAPLEAPASGAAFGFFVGFFSDNCLAGLQKAAFSIFGTVDKSPSVRSTDDTST